MFFNDLWHNGKPLISLVRFSITYVLLLWGFFYLLFSYSLNFLKTLTLSSWILVILADIRSWLNSIALTSVFWLSRLRFFFCNDTFTVSHHPVTPSSPFHFLFLKFLFLLVCFSFLSLFFFFWERSWPELLFVAFSAKASPFRFSSLLSVVS